MRGTSLDDLRLTQREVAKRMGVEAQVLAKWKREDLLVPSLDVPDDERRKGGNKHIYALRDLVAAEFARTTIHDLKIDGAPLREMVRLVQTADEERLKRAAIVTVRIGKMMRHVVVADLDTPIYGCASLGGPDSFKTGDRFIAHFRSQDRIVSKATLFEITTEILRKFQDKFNQELLAAQSGAGHA